ncbi:MAG: ABC transporter permease [Gammaproteobacteria bacterium]|nr:MAG: ABC transporter permease [Gammaproteobacteria bacterium]
MNSTILTVCRKEVIENSRDRRTLFSTLLFGPLFGPALFAIMINVMISQALSGAEEDITLPIVGQEHAPNLVAFLRRRGVEASADLESLEEATAAVREGEHEIVLVISPEFPANFRAGGDARVTLVFDPSQTRLNLSTRRVRGLLNAYSRQLAFMRLQARGISPLLLRPITIDEFDLSTATGRSVILLGMLTYLLLFATLMGGFHLAIDSTAGERERGSLEPLLTTPVARADLLLGKMAATMCYMMLSLTLTVAGFTVALYFAPLEQMGMSSNFGPLVALKIILILTPFVPLGAALMTLVASFTKSYKEAQTYLGLVLLVPTLPLIIATFLNIRPDLSLMWIPSLSQHLLIIELIKAEPLNLGYLGVSTTSTLLFGALLAWLAIRLYDRERLLRQ